MSSSPARQHHHHHQQREPMSPTVNTALSPMDDEEEDGLEEGEVLTPSRGGPELLDHNAVESRDDKDDQDQQVSRPTDDNDAAAEEEDTSEESHPEEAAASPTRKEGAEEVKVDGAGGAAAMETESVADETAATDKGSSAHNMDDDLAAAAAAEEETNNKQSYSTRGRSTTAENNNDPLERLARDALGDLARGGGETKEHHHHHHHHHDRSASAGGGGGSGGGTASGTSFLSDSLTEEERRTRTRYLPVVDGIRTLSKAEVKGDLALARSIMSGNGVASLASSTAGGTSRSRGSKRARSSDENDGMMDVDNGEEEGGGGAALLPSEDERGGSSSDGAAMRMGVGTTRRVEIGSGEVELPSIAFVAPPPPAQQQNGSSSSNGGGGSGESKKGGDGGPSPREVEAVTAFNPPRPPESVGAKKKHRMLRWERRPADIEVDLGNYRKTVQRTREELKKVEAECERVEAVDNHLRLHFFGHLRCLNEEWSHLTEELMAVQQECVTAADLLTSRTRSRGAGKGSCYVMRDVLNVLRSRGTEIRDKGLSLDGGAPQQPSTATTRPGIGGIGAISFTDWDRSTKFDNGDSWEHNNLADGWIFAGDRVRTPYGEGIVVAVYPTSELDPKAPPPPHENVVKATTGGTGYNSPMKESPLKPDTNSSSAATQGKRSRRWPRNAVVVAPRVAVRLPYGVGYFSLNSVASEEDPSCYSDAQLASRWKSMFESAASVGAALDVEAMTVAAASRAAAVGRGDPLQDGAAADVLDPATGAPALLPSANGAKAKLLPFGSGLLPTSVGRGGGLWNATLQELDEELSPALFQAGHLGVGDKGNRGVPATIREEEDLLQEDLFLRARVRQVRNELYRQRRNRVLNERTTSAMRERSARIESLVLEMRADLKSLKGRLDDEIRELGISEEEAEQILKNFYESPESTISESSSCHRPRRASQIHLADDDDMDDEVVDDQIESTSVEQGSTK